MKPRILTIDDDPEILALVELELGEEGFTSITAASGAEGLEAFATKRPDAVVLDLHLPDLKGQEILELFRRRNPNIPVVIFSAADSAADVVECMRLGAYDYITKPFDRTRLVTSVSNACKDRKLRKQLDRVTEELRSGDGFDALIGASPRMQSSISLLRKAAQSDVTVLIEGESGTGKEVAARALHAESKRRSGPFVVVNCGAIPQNLVESELFGYEKGAFTGANEAREGRFERADSGTIFLDELGELPSAQQVQLLRVIQERVVERLGGGAPKSIDLRIVAASNRNLKQEVAEGKFREDLYYRVAVFPVSLPPLRAREGDVDTLVAYFVEKFARRHGKDLSEISERAWEAIRCYRWPGNVRELENVMERAVILEDRTSISLSSLPDDIICALDPGPDSEADEPLPATTTGEIVIRPFAEEEKRIILRALNNSDWNVNAAARALGLGRATIYRKMERFDLKPER